MTKFAVFILSHGRANNVKTVKALRSSGYTGDVYIICDDEDDSLAEYKRIYRDKVVVFSKDEAAKYTDTVDNFNKRNIVLYARNATFEIARNLGITHFLVLDDDYTRFSVRKRDGKILRTYKLNGFDDICKAIVKFLDLTGADTVAMAQDGDYIGGAKGFFLKQLARKAMNSFFCRTEKPFKFLGSINEDVNAYTSLGRKGELFFTITNLSVHQAITQSQKGGLTEVYLDLGTYIKSFYSVIVCPSAVKVSVMGWKDMRIHHNVNWNACCPKIISDKWKKR